ncbi:MAG: hypothetical protein GY943_35310, partial [Chloroflexi bacterium]|nr:hypothetical protein [Chloroflexota bacterium]
GFLLQTAVLTRLCADLCDAICHSPTSRQILEQLEHHNVFLIPLDDDRRWYRYHHLFADLLQQRLRRQNSSQINELHQRASRWYEENGLINDALYHAHTTNNLDRVVQLIVTHMSDAINQGNSDMVFSWVKALPDACVRSHPMLAICRAWELLYSYQLSQIESYLVSAKSALQGWGAAAAQESLDEIVTIRAISAHYSGNSQQAVALCYQALTQISSENEYSRVLIFMALGGALRADGQTQAAISAFIDGIQASINGQHTLMLMWMVYQLHELYIECGRLHNAEQLLQHTLTTYSSQPELPVIGILYGGLGN